MTTDARPAQTVRTARPVPDQARVQYDAGPRFTPYELATRLGLKHPPTPEQTAVIAAPMAPMLVVAGAGSGKTETMAARVVWLVANEYVAADQVLGLTFTRKAAGELATRIRDRLGRLRRWLGHEPGLAGEPTITTYHSFAGRILTEHGVRAGYEPAARLLTEAARWQVVDTLVRTWDGDMSGVTSAPSTVVNAVLALAGELAEHLRDPDEVARWTGRFTAALTAPPGRMYAEVREVLARAQTRLKLLPLLREYERRKRDLEAVDFGDQLARAARLARDHPEVGAIERERFRVVLLDEYQDTSHAQVVLLRSLFGEGAAEPDPPASATDRGPADGSPTDRGPADGSPADRGPVGGGPADGGGPRPGRGHPVTAVGDPCQSIYGWRGASAGTLERFPEQFRTVDGDLPPVRQLTTSWRNRPEILIVANRLAAPLHGAGAQVARLAAARSPAPRLGGAAVRCTLRPTFLDEADWIADQLAAAWHAEPTPPTTAVLVRRRDQIAPIETALRARGLPVEVVGLGGLLDTPEVRDVVCTLRVLADPTDGPALLRLLTGARWRIGPRDLVALHRRARELVAGRHPAAESDGPAESGGRGGPGGPEPEPEIMPDQLDEAALAEALADLGEPGGYSPAGYRRLRAYASELAALRRRLDQPLPDLILDVERSTGLDVEVAVRSRAVGGVAGLARAHLDALGEVAARFAAEAPGAGLAAFLAYLAAAEAEERGLAPGEVEVVPGAVQLLTAHAAKGLEWDVVAVAGLTDRVWPAPPQRADHYLRGLGVLPFPLRGDRDGLPALSLSGVQDQRGVEEARQAFEAAWQAHDEREERRLAYVAVTRAKRLLLCSGYWWGDQVRKPRGPSGFLAEIAEQCRAGIGVVDGWAPPPPDEPNPTDGRDAVVTWPVDPLGDQRPALTAAADLVRTALRDLPDQPTDAADSADAADPVVDRWDEEVTLLLAERARRLARGAGRSVPLPELLTVSQLVTLADAPEELARVLRRPMPARPDPHTRRGTAFHRWLEQRYGSGGLLDLDDLPGAADADAADDDALVALRRRFLASEWAERVPAAVEVPFTTEVGGVVVRGRIDAVFAGEDGGFDVIDWKTGRRPAGAVARAAAVQLAVYRLAWAALAGVAVDKVRAGFHYVADGITVRPVDLLDADALTALVEALPAVDPATGGPIS